MAPKTATEQLNKARQTWQAISKTTGFANASDEEKQQVRADFETLMVAPYREKARTEAAQSKPVTVSPKPAPLDQRQVKQQAKTPPKPLMPQRQMMQAPKPQGPPLPTPGSGVPIVNDLLRGMVQSPSRTAPESQGRPTLPPEFEQGLAPSSGGMLSMLQPFAENVLPQFALQASPLGPFLGPLAAVAGMQGANYGTQINNGQLTREQAQTNLGTDLAGTATLGPLNKLLPGNSPLQALTRNVAQGVLPAELDEAVTGRMQDPLMMAVGMGLGAVADVYTGQSPNMAPVKQAINDAIAPPRVAQSGSAFADDASFGGVFKEGDEPPTGGTPPDVVPEQAKPMRLYRGQNDPNAGVGDRNLTKLQTTKDFFAGIRGKAPTAKPEAADFFYFTETPEVAQRYADGDRLLLERLGGNADEFRTLTGRDPRPAGEVGEYDVSANRVFDMSDLGEAPTANQVIRKIAADEGITWPAPGTPTSDPAWSRIFAIEQELGIPHKVAEDGDNLPAYSLLRNYEGAPKSGTAFRDWLASRGYDAVRYAEEGTHHVAVISKDQAKKVGAPVADVTPTVDPVPQPDPVAPPPPPPIDPPAAGPAAPPPRESEWLNLQRSANDEPTRNTLADAAERTADAQGWVKDDWRRTRGDVNTAAAAISDADVDARLSTPLQKGEIIADDMMARLRNDAEGLAAARQSIDAELQANGNKLSADEVKAFREKAEQIDARLDSIIKVVAPQRTARGQALAFMAIQAKAGFAHDYWFNRAAKVAGRDLDPETSGELRDILARGQAAQRALEAEKAAGVQHAPDDIFADLQATPKAPITFKSVVDFVRNLFRSDRGGSTDVRSSRRNQRGKLDLDEFKALRDKSGKDGMVDPVEAAKFLEGTRARLVRDLPKMTESDAAMAEARIKAIDAKIDALGAPPPSARKDKTQAQIDLDAARKELAQLFQRLDRTPITEAVASGIKAFMLSGIGTTLRNTGGNAIFGLLEGVSKAPGAAADWVISKGTGQRALGGMSPTAVYRSGKKAATEGVREALQVIRQGATDEDLQRFNLPREVNTGNKVVDTSVNAVFRFLSAQDKVGHKYAFTRSIEDQAKIYAREESKAAKAAGEKPIDVRTRARELAEKPTEAMVSQAMFDADEATFNNDNFIAGAYQSGRQYLRNAGERARKAGLENEAAIDGMNVGGKAVDLVVDTVASPFVKVPSNILFRILDYSAGTGTAMKVAGMGMSRAGKAISKKDVAELFKGMSQQEQRALSMSIGRGATGAALMWIGYQLAAAGLMTGVTSKDEKGLRGSRDAVGRPEGAIKVGGRWYQLTGIAPGTSPLLMGATFQQEGSRSIADEAKRPGRMIAAATRVVKEHPALQGASRIEDFLDKPAEEGGRMAAGIARSLVPTLLGNVAQTFDDTQRRADGPGQGMASKIPGARNQLLPKLDTFGRPIPQQGAFDIFNSREAREDTDPVSRAIVDTGAELTRPQQRINVKPRGAKQSIPIQLDPEQHNRLLEITGGFAEAEIATAIAKPDFANLGPEAQRKRIEDAWHKATKAGRKALIEEAQLAQ
jgi:hypothetical protein